MQHTQAHRGRRTTTKGYGKWEWKRKWTGSKFSAGRNRIAKLTAGLGAGLVLIFAAGAADPSKVPPAAGGLRSADAGKPRSDINPALLYWQAFDQRVDIPAEVRKEMFAEPPTLPLEAARPHLARYDVTFDRLRRAAQMRVPCDWGSDPADGPGAYMPNLVTLRKTAQLVPVRVHYALEAGEEKQAVDDLMAGLVLGRHTSQSHTLVTTMIGVAIESMMLRTLADHFQQLSPDALLLLKAELDAAPARATVKQAMAGEKTLFLEWIIGRLERLSSMQADGGQALDEFRRSMREVLNLNKVDGFAPEGEAIDRTLARYHSMRVVYDWVQGVASAPPDTLAADHQAFQERVKALRNPMADLLVPNILKARQTELRLNAHLAMVRAAIALRTEGEDAFRKIRDPYGDGPFLLRRLGPGEKDAFELDSKLRENDNHEVALKFTGPPAR